MLGLLLALLWRTLWRIGGRGDELAIPVVVTKAGGFPYLVQKGGGRFVPVGESSELAAALIEILSNEKLQRHDGSGES